MNIRLATVRVAGLGHLGSVPYWVDQAGDLLGMQACNLQNLPENYTLRYCESLHGCLSCSCRVNLFVTGRSLPCHDMAFIIVCR